MQPPAPISLRDLARRLELSPMVVSAILRDRSSTVRYQASRIEEVTAAALAHGYRPNNDIGILLPRPLEDATVLQHELVQGVVRHVAATQRGKGRVVTEVVEHGVPDLIREWQVGGVVVHAEAATPGLVAAMAAKGIPYVLVNPADEPAQDAVLVDDAAGVRRVVDDLAARGSRRAVCMLPPLAHRAGRLRRQAFAARCGELGLDCRLIESADFAQALAELLALARDPVESGLFTLSEWWLAVSSVLAATPGLRREGWRGTVLRNTATPWSSQPPQLRLPFAEMGRAAVDLLYRKWALRARHQPNEILQPQLR